MKKIILVIPLVIFGKIAHGNQPLTEVQYNNLVNAAKRECLAQMTLAPADLRAQLSADLVDQCVDQARNCMVMTDDKVTAEVGPNACVGSAADDLSQKVMAAVREKQNEQRKSGEDNGTVTQDQCEKAKVEAIKFCDDPIKANTDLDIDSQTAGLATQVLMMGGQAAAMAGGKGMSGICSMMKNAGMGFTGINGTLMARCNSKISDCTTVCTNAKKNPDNASIKATLDVAINVCRGKKEKAAAMGGSAAQSFYAAQMGRLCENAASQEIKPYGGPAFNPIAGTTDCTNPANAANPLCAPGGGIVGGVGAGFDTTGGGKNAMNGADGSDLNVADLDGFAQKGLTGNGAAGGEAKNPGVPGGGGSMLGGDSAGSGGGDDDKGRGQAAGGNANVLQGERGGGGYSAAAGSPASGGGWSGYGSGAAGDTEKRSDFDLKKYLPGEKNGPLRGPAGLGRATAEIAPMYEDIFKKITDRVQVVCKTNRLMDCN